MRCLVIGSTGYIGGRLVPRLLAEGHEVRVLVRDPRKLTDVPWVDQVQIVKGDVLDLSTLTEATADIEVLYYLVHSLHSKGFADLDRRGAELTAGAAADAGVKRIVYLGGLHPDEGELSEHLASRAEVGEVFLDSSVPAAVLQAAVIIGSGSASFEMLRYLTERLPVMVTPRWVHNRVQPIAVRDVLHYLVGCTALPQDVNRTLDIGGPDILSYLDLMRGYASAAGLGPRFVLPVPVLSPRLSSHWVNLVTPVPRSIATPLIDSLVHEAICHEHDIDGYIPPLDGGLTTCAKAIRLALVKIRDAEVETRWSDAAWAGAASDPLPSDPDWTGGSTYQDLRERETSASPEALWQVVEGIGGEHGWYSFPLAWSVRGWMDRLAGGVGLRRGRRDPRRLHVGDALDWWRVEELDHGHLLRLRAEMRVPGLAWLEMQVSATADGARYRQRAVFVPQGLVGHLYWWSVMPFHGIVFGGMVRNITGAAERGNVPPGRTGPARTAPKPMMPNRGRTSS